MVCSLANNNTGSNAQTAAFFSSSPLSYSCGEQEDPEEGRVEVTVQRLDGVAWVDCGGDSSSNSKHQQQLPLLTATVSFSGSAEDMRIGSSTVCGLTGQLLVESEPIHLDPTFVQSSNNNQASSSPDPLIPEHQAKDTVWLTAEWPEDAITTTTTVAATQHSTVTASTSTISTTTYHQPHVRMHFPGAQDPSLPKPCLVQSNRDSKIVKESSHHHHDPAQRGHKKTNSNATGGFLETMATGSTDFTTMSTFIAEGGSTSPELSPSLSLSSSSPSTSDHGSTTNNNIYGMEELLSSSSLSNHHHNMPYHQQQQQTDMDTAAAIEMARGESAFWSHSGQAMPEILELYIRLRCHDSSQNFADTNLWEGVSFLVLFGQEDDKGSHIIDLPVRRPFLSADPVDSEEDLCLRPVDQDSSSPTGPRLLLTSQARLRLKVTIIPDKLRRNKPSSGKSSNSGPQQHALPGMTTSIDAPSQESPVEVSLTRSTLEAKLKPLMDKIRENELLALQQWQAQKRAMDVHVPVPLNNNLNKDIEKNAKQSYFYYPARGPQYSMIQEGCRSFNTNHGSFKLNDSVFANMILSWERVVNLITLPCGSCDGRFSTVVDPGNHGDDGILQGRGNSPLVIDVDASNFQDDSSTIATRESWGI